MVIELQFRSVSIQPAEIEETYPLKFSAFQPYLPIQKSPKRRRAKRKRETVAHLIDPIIDMVSSS
jgi:hypothetical protein